MMKYLTILLSIYLTIFVNNLDVNSTNSYINSDELITTSSENYNIGCVNANILSNLVACTVNLFEEFKGCHGYVDIGRHAGHGAGWTNFRYYGRGTCNTWSYSVTYRDSGSHANCIGNPSNWITVSLHYDIYFYSLYIW